MNPASGIDSEIRHALAIEEGQRLVGHQHRRGRQCPSGKAERGDHANRLPVLHRPAAARVKDVAVTPAVDFEIAFVVAAGGERAAAEFEPGNRCVELVRMLGCWK